MVNMDMINNQSSDGVDGTHMLDTSSVGNSNALEERGTPPNIQRKVTTNARSTRARSTTYCNGCGMMRSQCDCWDAVNQT
jgi:hypothetical protein